MTALQAAAQKGSYLYIFFWKRSDQQTQSMRQVFFQGVRQIGDSVDTVEVNINDSREKAIVVRFDVSRAPMPLVLALAPNGAVTKGFPIRFTAEQLRQGIVSSATASCMKALQSQKLVLLTIQNQSTPYSQIAYRGAAQFKQDARFNNSTEIVMLDPADPAEAGFLQDLKVAPGTQEAVTVVLAPPGKPVATFTGPVTKQQIVAKVTSAQSGCCPGGKCGPGGCCPAK
jgi:hypothetical protein